MSHMERQDLPEMEQAHDDRAVGLMTHSRGFPADDDADATASHLATTTIPKRNHSTN